MSYSSEKGPINDYKFGEFVVNGVTHTRNGVGVGYDLIIFCDEKGDLKILNWKERAGSHTFSLGMTVQLSGLVESGSGKKKHLVVGNGFRGALKVSDSVLESVKKKYGLEYAEVMKTGEACRKFNEKYPSEEIILMAHGTC